MLISDVEHSEAIGRREATINELVELLSTTADDLDAMADQSENGWWSTHQVERQRKLASKLRRKCRSVKRSR